MAEPPGDRASIAFAEHLKRTNEAFKPYAPIELPEFFQGRTRHLDRLESEIEATGRHVALFGERGVGKTSLALLAAYFFLKRRDEDTHFVQCSRSFTFDDIFAALLASAGVDLILNGAEAESDRAISASLGPFSGGRTRRLRGRYRRIGTARYIEARHLLDVFGERNGLLVIDEYDRVEDVATHTRMAELIKYFSDARAKTKIIIVGVGQTVTQLVGEHESLSRSLAQIKLERMSHEELQHIIEKGENHIGVQFTERVKHRIIRLADGFPYFVHLLGRYISLAAARMLRRRAVQQPIVDIPEYQEGLRTALENAEASLIESYENAVTTTHKKSGKYELILSAMALSDAPDVQVQDIARNATMLTRGDHKPSEFSFHLGKLAGEDRGDVLTKVRAGYYRFTNPLLRPYIRLRLEESNLYEYDGQLEFPFMR